MPGEEVAYPKFQSAISKFRDIWPSVEISCTAAKRNSMWFNVATGIRLRPFVPEHARQMHDVILGDFLAIRRVVPSNQLDPILNELQHGTCHVGDWEILFRDPPERADGQKFPSHGGYYWSFQALDAGVPRCWLASNPDTRKFHLEGQMGPALSNFWNNEEWVDLEDRLRNCDPPVAGTQDLADNLLEYTCAFNNWQGMASVAVIAPLYAGLFPDIEARPTSISLRAFAPSTAKVDDFRLGIVVAGSGWVDRRRVPLVSAPEPAQPSSISMAAEVAVPEGLTFDATLLFRGVQVGSVHEPIWSENPRILAHDYLDKQFERLHRALDQPEGVPDARAFEIGLAWLFHLCGFQVVNYGLKDFKPDEEIDILAFVPHARQLLAVEATLKSPLNKDKLAKFRRRGDDLAKGLPNFEVLGAVVSASQMRYDAEVNEGLELGLVVLYRSDVLELFNLAVKNRPPREIFASLKQRLSPGFR